MAIPLLISALGGMGLLGAGRYAQDAYNDYRAQKSADKVAGLLGEPGQYQLPANQAGPQVMGTGLLGGEMNPQEFAARLLAVPGYQDIGKDALIAFNRAAVATPPSAVQEWKYYNGLTPEDKARYLTMKRATPTFQAGDVTMIGDPVTKTAVPFAFGEQPGAIPSQRQMQELLSKQEAEKSALQENVKTASKLSEDSFGRLEKVRSNIANYDEAVRLIESGAGTGVIESRLPSIRQSSIALDNLQGRLGLDVIGNTTFGALSEKELSFALDTALPKQLNGPELIKWIRAKQEAQQKLSAYLEQASTFLGTPGNTVKDWIELQKRNKQDMRMRQVTGTTSAQSGDAPTAQKKRLKYNPATGRIE